MTEVKLLIESIRVEGRHRKSLGDIESLAESMRHGGLIHAVVVTPTGRLLAGERRLAAARQLGWREIEARVVDTLDDALARLRIERDENTERKAMTPSELVALGEALEALERPKAVARKRAGGQRGRRSMGVDERSGSDEHQPSSNGANAGDPAKVRDVVATALGMSATTYGRAKAVIAAASDPASSEDERRIAQQALADMDSGASSIAGSFNRVADQVKSRTGPRQRPPSLEAAGSQRKAISAADTALSGICHGLSQIASLHPEITADEAARWLGSLTISRRILTRLMKHLKERTNATP